MASEYVNLIISNSGDVAVFMMACIIIGFGGYAYMRYSESKKRTYTLTFGGYTINTDGTKCDDAITTVIGFMQLCHENDVELSIKYNGED